MAATEKPTIDTTITHCSPEAIGKNSGKPYMKVKLGHGREATCFATGMFQDLRDAQQSGVQVRLTIYKNDRGYTSIDAIDPVPKPGAPPSDHFLGAGGAPAGTPGTSENPGPRTAALGNGGAAAAAPGDDPTPVGTHKDAYLCRAFCALAAGMVAWGGRFVQNEPDLWRMVGRFNRFVEKGLIPGFALAKPPQPVQPDANPGEEMPGYEEDL